MLTWEYGNLVDRNVNALFKTALVNHRESVFNKFGRLVCNVKIELLAVCFDRLSDNGIRHNISRSKLASAVIIRGKSSALAVKENSTLATNSLTYQKSFSVLFSRKSSRVELNS